MTLNWQEKTIAYTLAGVGWVYVGNMGYSLVDSSSNLEVLIGMGLLACEIVLGITALVRGAKGVGKWLEKQEDVPKE
jgi:hypothetical protein